MKPYQTNNNINLASQMCILFTWGSIIRNVGITSCPSMFVHKNLMFPPQLNSIGCFYADHIVPEELTAAMDEQDCIVNEDICSLNGEMYMHKIIIEVHDIFTIQARTQEGVERSSTKPPFFHSYIHLFQCRVTITS